MTKWIDQLLRETLQRRTAGTPPTPCLDAETVAAFADGAVSAPERSRIDAHVADCARCQALVAALITTMPVPVPRAWWRRPAIAWLAPAAVAATAVLIWVNLPRQAKFDSAVETAREAPRPAEPESNRIPPPAADAERQSQTARDSSGARSVAAARVREQARERSTSANETPAAAQPGVLADSRIMGQPDAPQSAAGAELRAPHAPIPSAALPQATTALGSAPSVEPPSGTPAAAPPPAAPSLGETVTLTTESSQRLLARRLEASRDTVILSSNPISRWRLGTAGVVHHSADGGSTWQTQSTGVNLTLTAGSSPSPSVCWLVGPAGVVLISTDEGRSWERVPFPVAVDLVSIRASDGRTATVVTADDRTFSTTDRGLTWTR
jgi:hypothetical protein